MDTTDLTRNLLDAILAGNAIGAEEHFNNILSVKATDAFDARKQELAQSLYSQPLSAEQGE